MPVAEVNLLSWANTLEDVRLPAQEARIDQLEAASAQHTTDLLSQSQTFTDTLAAHSVRITTAQDSADASQGSATSALTQIYDVELGSKTYTDQQIQLLRDELRALNTATTNAVPTHVDSSWQERYDALNAEHTAYRTELDSKVDQVRNEVILDLADIDTVTNEILNHRIPSFELSQEEYALDASGLRAQINSLTAGMSYPSVVQEMENIPLELEAGITEQLAEGSKTIFDTAIVLTKEHVTEGTRSIKKTGNPSFEEGWTGWFTLPGASTDVLGESIVKVGAIEGDDTGSVYQQDVKITILEHLTTGQRLIEDL